MDSLSPSRTEFTRCTLFRKDGAGRPSVCHPAGWRSGDDRLQREGARARRDRRRRLRPGEEEGEHGQSILAVDTEILLMRARVQKWSAGFQPAPPGRRRTGRQDGSAPNYRGPTFLALQANEPCIMA
jgi:hypothetical protein